MTAVSADAKTFYFPHSVDGAGFSMLFSLSNPGSAAATGTLSVFDSLGVPQALPFSTDSASQISISLPPNSTRVFTTLGTSNPAKVGFVAVQINQDAVTGVAVFRGTGFEASVLPVAASRKFAMFVERSTTFDTGISVVKLSEGTAITLTVYDQGGVAVAAIPYSFSGRKDAKFFGELFGSLSTTFQGMLIIEANGDIAPVGLRFGGGVLSTLPIVDLQPGPFISAVSPASGIQGRTIDLLVAGVNFQPTSTLSFSGSGITINSYTTRTATQIIASISIAGNAALGPRDVTVTNPDSRQATSAAAFTVTTVPLPSIAVAPSSLNFGNVTPGQTRDLTLTVSDNGNAPLTVSGMTSSNPAFSVVSPTVPFTVAAGGQQAVTVRFSPPGSGVQSGTLTIASNDTARPIIAVVMNGTGVAPTVRVLYVIPHDRESRSDYFAAVQNVGVDLRSWYRTQLGGKTFSLFSPEPEICRLPRSADYYATDSWNKVLADVQDCAPASYNSQFFVWLLYVDIVHACNSPGRLGAGTTGLTMMPRQDMDGLIGARYIDDCGVEYRLPVNRYIGGAGHELGHAFGLSHPPGCDEGLPSCDRDALMWAGYAQYPNTYLRPDEKELLLASPFFR